jgi:hypothetical protein
MTEYKKDYLRQRKNKVLWQEITWQMAKNENMVRAQRRT